MHELSIARMLLSLIDAHTPEGATVLSVQVSAGPLQAIDPDAMRFAWRAATQGERHEGAVLELTRLPWRLRCATCARIFESDCWPAVCACGSEQTQPEGGDALRLESMEIEDSGVDAGIEPTEVGSVRL
ncbi:MAG: hypothetical protein CMJ18_17865 [Phycisphaeraceae bacterium]|nr:hypothetical protein [Phycisphaeraceae bacterium]